MTVHSKPDMECEVSAELGHDARELPEGWVEVGITEVAANEKFAIVDGPFGSDLKLTDYIEDGTVPVLTTKNLTGTYDPTTVRFISEKKFQAIKRSKVVGGDILLAKIGSIGRCSIYPENAPAAIIPANLCKITVNPNIVFNRYLYLQIIAQDFQEKLQGITSATAQPAFSVQRLKTLTIKLAPYTEQRRIVTKLELLLEKVTASQQRLSRIPVLLKRFRQSILAAACCGKLTADWREDNPIQDNASNVIAELEQAHEIAGGHKQGNAAPPTDEVHDLTEGELPEGWSLTELRSAVCPDRPITYGILKPGPETSGGIQYVRVADFPNDRLNLSTIRRTTTEIEKSFARARLREGDILLSIRGTVGRVCTVPRELNGANITQDTARLSIQAVLNPSFVVWFLRAPITQKRMQRAMKGVAVRGINIGDVRALQLPVPPIAEQQEIVRRIEQLFAFADQIEARLLLAQSHFDRLTQSVLRRAFRGELVPTEAELARQVGRGYETASALLARMKKSREEITTAKPKRKRSGA